VGLFTSTYHFLFLHVQ